MVELSPFLVMVAWQSTVVLGAAAGLSTLMRRWPAYAHLVVTAGLIGTIACLIASFAVHQAGAGLLRAPLATRGGADTLLDHELVAQTRASSIVQDLSAAGAVPAAPDAGSAAHLPRADQRNAKPPGAQRWLEPAAIALWVVISLALLHRVLLRALAERRLVRAARLIDDVRVNGIAASVAHQLGSSQPVLRQAPFGMGPALWAWGRRPTILMPLETIASSSGAELRSVITHELAHAHRHDHLSLLLSSLMVVTLPWQPCAWWCQRRMMMTSEEACDAWVLALGASPRSYAGILMRLAAQRGASFALSAIGTRRRIHRRLAHILAGPPCDPRLRSSRVMGVASVTAATILSVSLAQPGQERVWSDTAADSAATPLMIEWVRNNALRLDTAGSDPAALDRFGDFVGDARVVAMGMSAPGSRELFEHARLLLEYLVEREGFTALVLGTSVPDCLALDEYVIDGRGDAEAALHQQGYWTYDTSSVLQTAEWIRQWNRTSGSPAVHLYGMDMQQAGPALDVAMDALGPFAAAEVEELRQRLQPLRDPYGIIDGYDEVPPGARARLTEAASRLVELFDEHRQPMIDATSASAWAVARQHGVIVRQFETWLRAHHAWLPPMGRRAYLDLWGRTQRSVGELIAFLEMFDAEDADAISEPLRGLASDPYSAGRSLAADPASRDLADRLVATLEALRLGHERLATPQQWEAARSDAATLAQWLAACATLPEATADEPGLMRNQLMADNVEWMLDELAPGSKLVIWDHSETIARHNPAGSPQTLGDVLAQRLGRGYRPIVLTFGRGAIQAIHHPIQWDPPFEQRLGPHALAGPDPQQIEAILLFTGLPAFVLDLRARAAPPPVRDWLRRPHSMWSIGSGYSSEREQRGEYAKDVLLPDRFDGLVFVDSSTPSRANERTRKRFGMDELRPGGTP